MLYTAPSASKEWTRFWGTVVGKETLDGLELVETMGNPSLPAAESVDKRRLAFEAPTELFEIDRSGKPGDTDTLAVVSIRLTMGSCVVFCGSSWECCEGGGVETGSGFTANWTGNEGWSNGNVGVDCPDESSAY